MIRSVLSLMLLFALFAALLMPPGAAAAERPNVILIMTDDQGYGDLGCHGNKVIRTPNLDRLHGQSVRLTNFHVDPTCAPTRSALMTGRYSHRVGVWHTVMGRSLLPAEETTMAEALAAAGYKTGIFGKWHLGDNYPLRPQDQGFQEVLIHGGGGVGQTPDYWGNDYFDDTYFHNGKAKQYDGYCTDVWFAGADQFITANKDEPFFAYIPTNAPHGPYLVADKYKQMYANNSNVPNAAFYGMITNIDENVGKLLARLDELKLTENTIVIFMTDNGSAAGMRGNVGYNAGMRGMKGSPYEGGHRVPCFVRWPAGGIGGGEDVAELAAHFDLLPTLLDLCKVPTPEGVSFDGQSLAPLLAGKSNEWPERTLVVESQRIETPQLWRQCSVMQGPWRLVDGKELYNVQADPGQKQNIAGEHAEKVEELRQAYLKWWEDVSANDDRYVRPQLGAIRATTTTLTCHDWHEILPPWHQSHVAKGQRQNSYWAVEVATDGEYEITLRRWAPELDRPINEGPGLKAETARVKIADFEEQTMVPSEAKAVSFRCRLTKGPTRLQTWFTDANGKSVGAYYVTVRRTDRE